MSKPTRSKARKVYYNFCPGRYYDLTLKSHQGKPFGIALTGNMRPFSKSFILLDLGGIFQYTLSETQVKWLLGHEKRAKERARQKR